MEIIDYMNDVEIDLDFVHFTSKKNTFPVTFLGEHKGKQFSVCAPKDTWKRILENNEVPNLKSGRLYVCGSLDKIGNKVIIKADHLKLQRY